MSSAGIDRGGRIVSVAPSGVVDFEDGSKNMYGCSPCPRCGSVYRCAFQKTMTVDCDDCEFVEPVEFAVEFVEDVEL